MSFNEIEEFMNGALISWIKSCVPRYKVIVDYESLLDGTILHSVYLQIDPEPQYHPVELKNAENLALYSVRLRNFDTIVRNLRNLYDEELGQTILELPDSTVLGHAPESLGGLDQMKLLITLLLGAAVQCPNKEVFIARIKEMDVNTQQAIAEVIKQVTDSQTLVLTQETVLTDVMRKHIVRLAKERDQYHNKWMSSVILQDEIMNSPNYKFSLNNSSSSATSSANTLSTFSAINHLADYKSTLRKLRHELEEKSELLMEVKEELDHKCTQFEKLQSESQDMYSEAMKAAAYRDEVDVLRERGERADRLEVEVQKLREKLSDAEFYRTRVEELREDNRMLLETQDILEEGLHRSRERNDQVATLEAEIIRFKQTLDDMSIERDANQIKLRELLEKNVQLELVNKDLMTRSDNIISLTNSDAEDDVSLNDTSLSEQLASIAQSRAIKLELENRRILEELVSLKESSSNNTLELVRDKNKFCLYFEELQENYSLLTQEKRVLEGYFKNALQENQNLHDTLDAKHVTIDDQNQDRNLDRIRQTELERQIESLTKEKQHVLNLCDSVQRRATDLEHLFESKTKELLAEYDSMKQKSYEVEENIEWEKKVQELEKENHELLSKTNILYESVITLNKDQYIGTLAKKQVEQSLKLLGLNEIDIGNNDMNLKLFVEKLCQYPESLRTIQEIVHSHRKEVCPAEKLLNLETATPSAAKLDQLQTENTALRSLNALVQEKFFKEGSSFTQSSIRKAVLDTNVPVKGNMVPSRTEVLKSENNISSRCRRYTVRNCLFWTRSIAYFIIKILMVFLFSQFLYIMFTYQMCPSRTVCMH